jgi:hypothetical protein
MPYQLDQKPLFSVWAYMLNAIHIYYDVLRVMTKE